jgi:uncharacterized MAPEG superfamily protein
MTVPFWCVLLAYAVTYGTKIPVAIAMSREGRGYDNKNPREQQARLTGWGKRAVAAQNNGFEVSAYFAACVFIGHLSGGDAKWSAVLAVLFLISRVGYVALYLADLASLRSLVWGLGMAAATGIALSAHLSGSGG